MENPQSDNQAEDFEFREFQPAVVSLAKRQARAWGHAEQLDDERRDGPLWPGRFQIQTSPDGKGGKTCRS